MNNTLAGQSKILKKPTKIDPFIRSNLHSIPTTNYTPKKKIPFQFS